MPSVIQNNRDLAIEVKRSSVIGRRSSLIGIDAHMVGTQETGNETYIVELAAALGRLGGYDYKLYTPHPQLMPPELRRACESEALSVRVFPNVPSLVRIPFLYPRMARQDGLGLLHMTYVAPPRLSCPLVLTIHDVSYRIFPRFFSPRVLLQLALTVGPGVRRARRIIAISESTKRDIVRFYRVSPRRIIVTPLAAGSQFSPQSENEIGRIRQKYDLPERYVLAVGNKQPRKNLPRLVQAFGSLAADMPEVALVIAGQSGWQGSEVDKVVREMGLDRRVRFTGFVPAGDLPALYSGAEVFCFPSLYEGFGLPPLEAMACGAATITSNSSSLPEVVGDSALTIDPTSVADLTRALRSLLQDEALRRDYSRRGIERAALFSWDRTARMTRDAYDAVLRVGEV
jgi:glycosyltransferase involved in cell wall biosynthesis